MKLTARTIDSLPAVDKPTIFFDADLKGFGVRVMPRSNRSERGSRTWIVEYRPGAGGRSVSKRRLSLGSVAVLEAGEARTLAKDVLAQVRLGQDPAASRSEIRNSATVAELVTRYQQETGAGRKSGTKRLYQGYWRLHLLPEIGSMKARDVKRTDITRLHRKVGATHETTANRSVRLLAQFYRWAGEAGAVPEGFNPAKGVDRYRESARERYLSVNELERLGAAILEAETIGIPWEDKPGKVRSKHAPKKPENRRTRISPHAAAAIRLLLFTGARLREILHLRWSEVDLQRGLLLLPDSKTGRKVIVLGSAALQVIADLDKSSDFVIAGQKPKPKPGEMGHNLPPDDKPRSDLNRPWALISKRAGLKGVRLHDLRHTFASYGASGGLGLPLIGGLLGHADSRTTARYAHLASDPLKRANEVISGAIASAMGQAKRAARANG